jgi:hypothetical protein
MFSWHLQWSKELSVLNVHFKLVLFQSNSLSTLLPLSPDHCTTSSWVFLGPGGWNKGNTFHTFLTLHWYPLSRHRGVGNSTLYSAVCYTYIHFLLPDAGVQNCSHLFTSLWMVSLLLLKVLLIQCVISRQRRHENGLSFLKTELSLCLTKPWFLGSWNIVILPDFKHS